MNDFIKDLIRHRENEYYKEIGESSRLHYGKDKDSELGEKNDGDSSTSSMLPEMGHCYAGLVAGGDQSKFIIMTNIQVIIMQDNPKTTSCPNIADAKKNAPTTRSWSPKSRLQHEAMHHDTTAIIFGKSQQPPAPPPTRFMASPARTATDIFAPTPPLSSSLRRKRASGRPQPPASSPSTDDGSAAAGEDDTTEAATRRSCSPEDERRRWSGCKESPTSVPKYPQRAVGDGLSPIAGSPTTPSISCTPTSTSGNSEDPAYRRVKISSTTHSGSHMVSEKSGQQEEVLFIDPLHLSPW